MFFIFNIFIVILIPFIIYYGIYGSGTRMETEVEIEKPNMTFLEFISDNIYKINEYEDKKGDGSWTYLFLLLLSSSFAYFYFYMMKNKSTIEKTWEQQKCSPPNLLIAGWFKPDSYKKTSFEYTYENFMECSATILKKVIPLIFVPYQNILVTLNSVFNSIISMEFDLKLKSKSIRFELYKYFDKLYNQIKTIFVPIQKNILIIRDALAKFHGAMFTSIKFIEGIFKTLRAVLFIIYTNINLLMLDMYIWMAMVVIYATTFIPATAGLAIPWIMAYIASVLSYLIPIAIMNIIYERFLIEKFGFKPLIGATTINGKSFTKKIKAIGDAFKPVGSFVEDAGKAIGNAAKTVGKGVVQGAKAVGKGVSKGAKAISKGAKKINPFKRCFDENTLIETLDGFVKIKNLKINTKLKNGYVTCTFCLSSKNQTMYNLNDVIVSSNHKVLYNDEWIDVEKHPDAIPLENYTKPYIYCLNTSKKRIVIHDTIFSDWDELDEDDFKELNQKYKDVFNQTIYDNNIHNLLQSGLSKDTPITLEDGRTIPLQKIEVNDVLHSGEIVYGKVEISSDNIEIFDYFIENNIYTGGPNLQLLHKTNVILDTFDLVKYPSNKKETKLYHLLTDTNTITIDRYTFLDYNGAIETLLENDKIKLIDTL